MTCRCSSAFISTELLKATHGRCRYCISGRRLQTAAGSATTSDAEHRPYIDDRHRSGHRTAPRRPLGAPGTNTVALAADAIEYTL